MSPHETRDRIRDLNDAFRASLITQTPLGKLYATAGIAAHGADFQNRAIEAVVAFSDFTEDIDPSRTHNMMCVTIDGIITWAKIDYYDKADPDLGADDPSNAETTERVMTLLKHCEY